MDSTQNLPTRKQPMQKARPQKLSFKPRNPDATRERIIQSAINEFSVHGFKGARVQTVAKNADTNLRMIYHYFGNKEGLYISTLERVYRDVRVSEQDLQLEHDDPLVGLERLINFTFQHFAEHPDLINLVMGENLLRGQYLIKSDLVPSMSAKLRSSVAALLKNGIKMGVFRKSVDPVQLWITIFALCWVHLSNKYTLSWMLQLDLTDPRWLERRRQYVVDVIIGYLCSPPRAAKVDGHAKSRPAGAPRRGPA